MVLRKPLVLVGGKPVQLPDGDRVAGVDTIALIRTPANVSPASGTTGIGESPTLAGSPYYSLYSTPMAASQWQVSTVADFATTVVSTGDIAGTATTYTAPAGVLNAITVYYWRVRYKDAEGVYSAWSEPTSFTTAAAVPNSYIETPTPTPASFGDPFEGGFYTGMLWNQLVQSATSTAIGTGTKTFTVPDMAANPIVYGDQELEIRSRANPSNKMVGTVTGAKGTTLTINVTSVEGSGTFTDWSIMSRYRLIVAPKSGGQNASISLKNANSALPTACQTLTEGWLATEAMKNAGTSTEYPAAHWARGLSIGGFDDWFIPARDQLELCWRNLKPTTDNNYLSRDAGASFNYTKNGSYGDVSPGANGINLNSSPQGAAYTSGNPAQTAVEAFKTGGAEAFDFVSNSYYVTCSEAGGFTYWVHRMTSGYAGYQQTINKNETKRLRVVRRSII